MIRSLTLTNFESHEDSLFRFHPGVNAIIGESDAGKSAVVRSLLWCLQNGIPGSGFCRHGTKTTEATVVLKEGTTITRTRKGKTGNLYQLDDVEFAAFRDKVPEEIANAVNMDSLNYQLQFDPHFLLTESAGQVSRILNKAVNLDVIDRSTTAINQKEKSLMRTLESEKETLKDLKEQLKHFSSLDELESLVELWEKKTKECVAIEEDLTGIEDLVEEIRNHKLNMVRTSDANVLRECLEKQERIEASLNDDTLPCLEEELVNIEGLKAGINKRSEEIEKIREELGTVCPICGGEIE